MKLITDTARDSLYRLATASPASEIRFSRGGETRWSITAENASNGEHGVPESVQIDGVDREFVDRLVRSHRLLERVSTQVEQVTETEQYIGRTEEVESTQIQRLSKIERHTLGRVKKVQSALLGVDPLFNTIRAESLDNSATWQNKNGGSAEDAGSVSGERDPSRVDSQTLRLVVTRNLVATRIRLELAIGTAVSADTSGGPYAHYPEDSMYGDFASPDVTAVTPPASGVGLEEIREVLEETTRNPSPTQFLTLFMHVEALRAYAWNNEIDSSDDSFEPLAQRVIFWIDNLRDSERRKPHTQLDTAIRRYGSLLLIDTLVGLTRQSPVYSSIAVNLLDEYIHARAGGDGAEFGDYRSDISRRIEDPPELKRELISSSGCLYLAATEQYVGTGESKSGLDDSTQQQAEERLRWLSSVSDGTLARLCRHLSDELTTEYMTVEDGQLSSIGCNSPSTRLQSSSNEGGEEVDISRQQAQIYAGSSGRLSRSKSDVDTSRALSSSGIQESTTGDETEGGGDNQTPDSLENPELRRNRYPNRRRFRWGGKR